MNPNRLLWLALTGVQFLTMFLSMAACVLACHHVAREYGGESFRFTDFANGFMTCIPVMLACIAAMWITQPMLDWWERRCAEHAALTQKSNKPFRFSGYITVDPATVDNVKKQNPEVYTPQEAVKLLRLAMPEPVADDMVLQIDQSVGLESRLRPGMAVLVRIIPNG